MTEIVIKLYFSLIFSYSLELKSLYMVTYTALFHFSADMEIARWRDTVIKWKRHWWDLGNLDSGLSFGTSSELIFACPSSLGLFHFWNHGADKLFFNIQSINHHLEPMSLVILLWSTLPIRCTLFIFSVLVSLQTPSLFLSPQYFEYFLTHSVLPLGGFIWKSWFCNQTWD